MPFVIDEGRILNFDHACLLICVNQSLSEADGCQTDSL